MRDATGIALDFSQKNNVAPFLRIYIGKPFLTTARNSIPVLWIGKSMKLRISQPWWDIPFSLLSWLDISFAFVIAPFLGALLLDLIVCTSAATRIMNNWVKESWEAVKKFHRICSLPSCSCVLLSWIFLELRNDAFNFNSSTFIAELCFPCSSMTSKKYNLPSQFPIIRIWLDFCPGKICTALKNSRFDNSNYLWTKNWKWDYSGLAVGSHANILAYQWTKY